MNRENVSLIFHAKDNGTSGRWQKDYNQDLCFETIDVSRHLYANRKVLNDTLHVASTDLSLIKFGIHIPITKSIQKPKSK